MLISQPLLKPQPSSQFQSGEEDRLHLMSHQKNRVGEENVHYGYRRRIWSLYSQWSKEFLAAIKLLVLWLNNEHCSKDDGRR